MCIAHTTTQTQTLNNTTQHKHNNKHTKTMKTHNKQ